jgi:hypothetical protein
MRFWPVMTMLALGVALGPGAPARAGDDAKSGGGKDSGNTRTICGTVAGVTVVGEAAINYETRQAEVARGSVLTVVGSPLHDGRDARKSDEDKDKGKGGDREPRSHRANVYLIALTPQTKVCEAQGHGDSSSGKGDRAGQATSTASPAAFEKLELGDRVEVKFTPAPGDGRASMDRRHGRHRTFRGDAIEIKILPAHHDHESRSSSERSSK